MSLDLRELRIGNLIAKGNRTIKVCSIHAFRNEIEDEENNAYFIEEVEPIPLTEEWLIRFGFKVVHRGNIHYSKNYRKYYSIHIFPRDSGKWNIAFGDTLLDKERDYIPDVELEYVHQLQNIFHSLTGEELTLKE